MHTSAGETRDRGAWTGVEHLRAGFLSRDQVRLSPLREKNCRELERMADLGSAGAALKDTVNTEHDRGSLSSVFSTHWEEGHQSPVNSGGNNSPQALYE